MPFKSQSQKRKFFSMAREGKISQKTLQEWQAASVEKALPERIGVRSDKKTTRPFSDWLKKRVGKR